MTLPTPDNTYGSAPSTKADEHHSRAPEFYGFVAWTSTYLLFVLYVLWTVLPDEFIVWIGVTWYPNREWALLVPAWTTVVVLLTYIAYWALALRATPTFDDMRTICDMRASLPVEGSPCPYLESTRPDAVPELYDIPIGMVNRVLFRRPDQQAT